MGTGKDLKEEVAKWLEGQGYPFELQVGRQLRAGGWNAGHARYYRDTLTGKVRELDIHAARHSDFKGEAVIGLSLAIECKRSRAKPWVIFSSSSYRIEIPFPHAMAIGAAASAALLSYTLETDHKGRIELLQSGDRRGHGIVQALGRNRQGVNLAYSAARSATSAVLALTKGMDELVLQRPLIQVTIPVVVFDGALFELHLMDNGEESLEQIHYAKLYTPRPDGSGGLCVVVVCTPTALPTLLQEANVDFDSEVLSRSV